MEENKYAKYCYYTSMTGYIIILILFANKILSREVLIIFAYGFPIIAAAGTIIEFVPKVLRQTRKLFQIENPFYKWLLSLVAAGIGLSLVIISGKFAGNIINNLTNENPSFFSNSRILLSGLTGAVIVLLFIVSAILTTIILYVGTISILSFLGMLGLRIKWLERVRILQAFGRAFGGIALMGILGTIAIAFENFSGSAPHLLVFADYYAGSPCTNQKATEYVAFLDRDQISVAVPTGNGSYRFERRSCERLNK